MPRSTTGRSRAVRRCPRGVATLSWSRTRSRARTGSPSAPRSRSTDPWNPARGPFGCPGSSRPCPVTRTRSAALEGRLSAGPYTLTTPGELIADLRASTADFRAMIALVAAVSLFGGAFLIFNTLAMTVAERARDVGLLRAAGMTRRQVTLLVLISAGHLGVAGVALGLVIGVGLAAAVTAYLSPGGAVLASRDLVIPPARIPT